MGYRPSLLEPGEHASQDLSREMRRHIDEPFPASVVKGDVYGEVNSVLIDADVYGWALKISHGKSLPSAEFESFARIADMLARSIAAFPQEAQPYYERVLRIARLALEQA